MAKLFNELRERLLRAGVAPRHVRRYLSELADHVADLKAEEERSGRSPADAEAAALLRLGGTNELLKAMTGQRQFQAWCTRAPWAMFGLVPLSVLAAAYGCACLILWTGWRVFLPGTETPFVRVDGLAMVYFTLGRATYYGAPMLIGWGIGLLAARQRFSSLWPAAGWVLIALAGASAQVHASRQGIPGGTEHVGMGFTLGTSAQAISSGLSQALVIFALMAVPYLIWRLGQARSLSA